MLINFDYDGVLVDSLDDLLHKSQLAQAQVGMGRSPTRSDFETLENMTFHDLAWRCGIPTSCGQQFVDAVFALQSQDSRLPRPFPGMVSAVRRLAERHRVTIITSSYRDAVLPVLQQQGLDSAISLILDGRMPGAKADKIALAQQQFPLQASPTVMVGDAISDIRQGKRAGALTVGVAWGFQQRELLAAEQPEYLVDHVDDLLAVLHEIAGT